MSDLELDIEILFSKADFNSHIEKGTIEMNNEYFNLLQEKMARIINENQELKKQLEASRRVAKHHLNRELELENQQKEFIKYLEDEIKRLEENNIYQPLQKMALETHKHNLLRYKEIIGDK